MPAIANYVQEIRNIIVKLPPFIRTKSEPRKARHSEFSCFCVAKCESFGEQKKTREVSVANDERPYFNNPSIYFLTSAPLPRVKSFPPLKSAPLANFARSLPLRPRPLPPLVQRVMSFLPFQF